MSASASFTPASTRGPASAGRTGFPAVLRGSAAGSSKLAKTSFDVAAVFDLKGSQTGVEQLAPGDNDDIKTRRNLMTTENLSNQAFRSISLNRAPQAPCGGDPQPADRQLVRQNEQSGKAAVNPGTTLVNLLKFSATADVFVSPETSHGFGPT
jgi:hypothetical protein